MCNCNNTNPCSQTTNICGQKPCTPTQDCSCPTRLNTECVTYNGLDLECSGIESGLDLNQTLQLLDTYICDAIAEINNSINLINVGTGLQIYAGIDAIGRRKIRSLITTGDLLTSVQNTDDITIGIDETELSQFVKDNQKTYSVANVGTGAEIYKDSTVVGDNEQFNKRTLTSINGSVNIVQNADTIDFSVPVYDGSKTEVIGSSGITVTGAGTIVSPYIVSTDNLQKTISSNYVLTNADNNYTILIDNDVNNISITIPSGLTSKISVCFIQQGTGSVTFLEGVGVTINNPIGFVIKGQHYWAYIEQVTNTNTYQLLGATKV